MNNRDEISQIRAELERVQRNVARLAQRLDEVEARENAGAEKPLAAIKSVTPEVRMPPPLPASAFAPAPAAVKSEAAPSFPPEAKVAPTAPTPPVLPRRPLVPPPPPKTPRRFGPPEGMGWEMALTTWWLPRIGVFMMALGLVWGLTFVSDKFRDSPWMPFARVALGYALALGLGGIGWKLEKKYAGYARVLMGGGFGLLYFVTFATWYIPPTRIAPSQEFTLLLLALLVVAWGAMAQWRKSQLIALSMTLLGHFTVALSTLSLDTPSRAAVGGLLVLGIGSAFFLIRNGWYSVALSAMIGSYINQFFWLAKAPPSGAPMDFALGMAVLATYLVLYALADRFTPHEHASTRTRTRNIYCGLNTGGFLLLGLALMQGFEFAQGKEYLLYFATAAFAGGMGWSYVLRPAPESRHTPDSLANIYFTKASMLATAGIAAWLDGPSVTLAIALQSLALLAAARHSQRPVGRILSLGTALVAFVHGWYTLDQGGFPLPGMPGHTGQVLVALLTMSVFWAIAELYRVTPWHTYPEGPWRGPEFFRDLCASLEMAEYKEGAPILPSRMIFSHVLVAFGALLVAGQVRALFPLYYGAPALCLLGLAAAGLGLALRSAPVLAGSAFYLILGLAWWLVRILGGHAQEPNGLLVALACVAAFFATSELFRRFLPSRFETHALDGGIQGAWKHNPLLLAHLTAAGAALIIATGLQERTESATALLASGAIALLATGYAAATGAANLGLLAVLLTAFTIVVSPQVALETTEGFRALRGAILAAAAATAVEHRGWGLRRPGLAFHRLLPMPYLLYGCAAWNTIWMIDAYCPEYLHAVILAGAAAAFAVALLVLHARAMASMGAVLMAVALVAWLSNQSLAETRWWHIGALAIVALSIAGDRFLTARNPFNRPWPARALLCCAWVVCLAWNGEMGEQGWHYTGMALIAGAFLAWAALFRSRTAGALSILTGVFATFPLIVATEHGMTLGALWAGYSALIVYWLAAERGVTMVLNRIRVAIEPAQVTTITVLLAGTPTLLGVLCLSRVDTIQNFYLTMAWTAWGLAIFCWALFTRQPWFRYMGLGVFALALARTFFVDVWRLEVIYRVGAVLFLGAALLTVAYGYTRWRTSQTEKTEGDNTPEEDRP
jgi:hypothetical protein